MINDCLFLSVVDSFCSASPLVEMTSHIYVDIVQINADMGALCNISVAVT